MLLALCLHANKAKRKKHRVRKSEAVHQRHAAQIYTEMLGQVCHKGLYELNINGFQEVCSCCDFCSLQSFMIHARHAIFYIYYAKFPNGYLWAWRERIEPFCMRFPKR